MFYHHVIVKGDHHLCKMQTKNHNHQDEIESVNRHESPSFGRVTAAAVCSQQNLHFVQSVKKDATSLEISLHVFHLKWFGLGHFKSKSHQIEILGLQCQQLDQNQSRRRPPKYNCFQQNKSVYKLELHLKLIHVSFTTAGKRSSLATWY